MGDEPRGEFYGSSSCVSPKDDKDLSLSLTIGALCNNAIPENKNGTWRIIGDRTEGALIVEMAIILRKTHIGRRLQENPSKAKISHGKIGRLIVRMEQVSMGNSLFSAVISEEWTRLWLLS